MKLESTVNTDEKTVSAEINHFSEYALLVSILPLPACFALADLNIVPDRVSVNDPVMIQTIISNTGGTAGSYTVVLKVNGIDEARKEVLLEPGENKAIAFRITSAYPRRLCC
jgi:hypothetical protein